MYRTVDVDIWDDPWFTELDPLDKLLFMYLFTNRRTTACGAFEITLKAVAFETGLSLAQVGAGLPRLEPKMVWFAEHQVIFVRNFYKRQRAQSNKDNFKIAAIKKLVDFHRDVQRAIWETYPELCTLTGGLPSLLDAIDTHTQPIPNPYPSVGYKETVNATETEEGEDAPTPAKATPSKATSYPEDFTVTEDMTTWAKKNVPELDIGMATEEWELSMRSNRTRYKYTDWTSAWYKAMRNAAKWEADRPGHRSNGKARDSTPNLTGPIPPQNYSWDKDAKGHWKPHEWSEDTQSYPYGCATVGEALNITAERRQEYIRRRETGKGRGASA